MSFCLPLEIGGNDQLAFILISDDFGEYPKVRIVGPCDTCDGSITSIMMVNATVAIQRDQGVRAMLCNHERARLTLSGEVVAAHPSRYRQLSEWS
jgi:hypothetical protein